MSDIFLIAARKKFRFDTSKGPIAAEDLFDLPLTSTVQGKPNLDDVARALYKEFKGAESEISFVTPAQAVNTEASVKLEIVKAVIAIKQAENASKLAEQDRAAKKQQLLELISKKQTEGLSQLSIDELNAQLAAL